MSRFLVYALVSVALFGLGLYGLLSHTHLLRKVLALNVMGAATFLLLVALAHRNRDVVPDPVPQAMVLTGIVVAVSATGFALALARRIHARTGRVDLEEGEGEGDDRG
jgi:multicomponent Na+:H+ antiporter subunit C